jgi:8-oxo-dGTP pyrophosphatase MutT (NUDIX family)
MEKFSKLNKNTDNSKEPKIVYDGKHKKIINWKDCDFVLENDMVIILPIFVDDNTIMLRHEPIPTYQYKNINSNEHKHVTHFLTAISGSIEKGESVKNAVRRELYEETGVVLSDLFNFDIDKDLYLNKGNSAKYHICFLEIRYNDYKLSKAPGDGSEMEKDSKTLNINVADIDKLRTHDLITDYLLTKFKLIYLKK